MINDDYQTTGLIPKFVLEAEDTPLCAESDPELFYPIDPYDDFKGDKKPARRRSPKYIDVKAAKEICKKCPLITDCLIYALESQESGIWGGTTEEDRKLLRRRFGTDSGRLRYITINR